MGLRRLDQHKSPPLDRPLWAAHHSDGPWSHLGLSTRNWATKCTMIYSTTHRASLVCHEQHDAACSGSQTAQAIASPCYAITDLEINLLLFPQKPAVVLMQRGNCYCHVHSRWVACDLGARIRWFSESTDVERGWMDVCFEASNRATLCL